MGFTIGRLVAAAGLSGVAAVGALVATAPSAAADTEYKVTYSNATVDEMYNNIPVIEDTCGWVLNFTPVSLGSAILCAGDDELKSAVEEAHWKGCSIDAYFTDGPMSYDVSYRYVVCP